TALFSTTNLSNIFAAGQTGTTSITSTGFLGVGTTTPWAELSINPTSANGAAPSFAIGSSTGTSFVVTNAGLTGIGTTSPWATLAVHALASSTQQTLFAIGSTTNSAGAFNSSTLFSVNN